MSILTQPRFWLFLWGGAGAALVIYVILAASVQSGSETAPSALRHDASLISGEMADFQYAYAARRAPAQGFDYEGEKVSLADFRGKAVLVNFWATTCAPCLKELPSLDALQEKLGDNTFEVVAVAADPRGPESAKRYLDRLNIRHLKLYTDERLSFAFSVGGADILPASILYDADGNEVGRIVGEADWVSPEAIRLVESAKP